MKRTILIIITSLIVLWSVCGAFAQSVDVDITDSVFSSSDTQLLKIEKVTVPGFANTFWAQFKWNPDTWSFDLNGGGEESYQYPRSDRLVDPKWVKDELIDGNNQGKRYVIAEVGWGTAENSGYEEGHVPGAIHVNTDEIEYDCFNARSEWPIDPGDPPCWDRSTTEEEDAAKGLDSTSTLPRNYWDIYPDRYLLPAIAYMGIDKDTTVVVYGNDVTAAARLIWTLFYAGVEDVRLLDGGYNAWIEAGYEGETKTNNRQPVNDFGAVSAMHPEYLADSDSVRNIVSGDFSDAVIGDVRTYDEFIGASRPYSYIPTDGRIAGAVWAKAGEGPWTMEDYVLSNGQLKPLAQIEAMWKEAGITSDKEVIFYCGTAWRSSLTWFFAYMMGWERIRNYDDSWYVWSMGPDAAQNPVVDERPGLPVVN